jgi:hypothetical protein
MTSVQILNYVIGALVAIYNGLIVLFMMFLRRRHNDVWASFAGKGIFETSGPIDSYRFVRTGFYALFEGGHRKLKDRRATAYVFAIRAMLVALIPLVLVYEHLRGRI